MLRSRKQVYYMLQEPDRLIQYIRLGACPSNGCPGAPCDCARNVSGRNITYVSGLGQGVVKGIRCEVCSVWPAYCTELVDVNLFKQTIIPQRFKYRSKETLRNIQSPSQAVREFDFQLEPTAWLYPFNDLTHLYLLQRFNLVQRPLFCRQSPICVQFLAVRGRPFEYHRHGAAREVPVTDGQCIKRIHHRI